jgi:hypothetical protein
MQTPDRQVVDLDGAEMHFLGVAANNPQPADGEGLRWQGRRWRARPGQVPQPPLTERRAAAILQSVVQGLAYGKRRGVVEPGGIEPPTSWVLW